MYVVLGKNVIPILLIIKFFLSIWQAAIWLQVI